MGSVMGIRITPYRQTYEYYEGLTGLTVEEQEREDMRIEREIDEALEREREMRLEERDQ